jgi:hypothetical protein
MRIKGFDMANKYAAVGNFLLLNPDQNKGHKLKLSFGQIEIILGDKLPVSARKHRQWWENESNPTHVQDKSIDFAIWSVASVDSKKETVTFIKD